MRSDNKFDVLFGPTTAVTAASTNLGYVDTRGFDHLIVNLVTNGETTGGQYTALTLREGDTTASAYTDHTAITTFQGGTAVDSTHAFVLQTASTVVTAYNISRFNVPLDGRKRYISLNFTPSETCRAFAVAELSRCQDGPAQAAIAATAATRTTEGVIHSVGF